MAPRKSGRTAAAASTQATGGIEKKKASKASASASPAKAAAKPAKVAAKPAAKKGALSIGDKLPDFSVEADTSTEDKKVTQDSQDIAKDNGAVIFFYPRANTGGCTKQALGFNENAAKLEKAGYKVFGMSADKPKSQANWKAKYSLTYTLLSDPSYQVLKSLGVTKGEKQIARSHIVIGKGGVIEDVQIGVSPGDSVAKAVEKILKDGGAEAEAAAEEVAETTAEKQEEKPAKKAKKAKK